MVNEARTSFLCIELNSIALGYQVLKALTEETDVRVLEASPAADHFVIFLTCMESELPKLEIKAREALGTEKRSAWIDSESITRYQPQLVDALYNLPQTQAKETLVVVECLTISTLISVAQRLLGSTPVDIIEIKIKRSGNGGAYAFFTGSSLDCATAARIAREHMKLNLRKGRVELIEPLSPTFRSFFNLNGEA